MLKYTVAIILFILPLTPLFSQQTIKINGTVTSIDNTPIDFVRVSIAGTTNADYTNREGKYQVSIPAKDSVVIEFSALGYQKTERKIAATSNKTINIMLREVILNEVTVVGSKAQTNTSSKIDIGNTNLQADVSGGSIESIIATKAGVSNTNELSNQYSVRGGNYDENIVYVNGIEIYRPLLIRSAQQEGLSFINPNMTESVDFSTGGFEASYGDKMSSVLDIQYKKPKKFESSVTASLLGASAYIGSSSKNYTQITGLRYKTTRSLLGTTDTKAEYNPTYIDAQTYITLKLSSIFEINLLGNLSTSIYKFTPQSRDTKFGTIDNVRNFKVYFDGWEHDKFQTYFGAISLKAKPKTNLELGVTGSSFSSREFEHYDITGEYTLTGEGDSESILGIGKYHNHARNKLNADITNISHNGSFKIGNHNLKWGISTQHEKIKDAIIEWAVRDSAGYVQPNIPNYDIRSQNSINSTRNSAYLQNTYLFETGENVFYLNAGVRVSNWSFNKETIISPRASIAFIPNGTNFTFRFATGLYYQSPFYKEIQKIQNIDNQPALVLNTDIKSQKSIHFILGSDYKFTAIDRPFKFTSELYYKKLSDLIPYTIDNVKVKYMGENKGSGYSMGMDFSLFGQFVEGVDSWISFSLMKTEQVIGGEKAPLPSDQRYNISLFFQDYLLNNKRLTANIKLHFSEGLPQIGPNSGYLEKGYFRTPSYKRADIGIAWQLLGEDFAIRNKSSFLGSFKNIWLGADIFNLFDIKNTNSYYWIKNTQNQQYAIPNYLTGRQFNFKIVTEF